MGPSPDVELVEVQLELEHHAIPRKKLTREGFTHDWTVRVRGPDDCRIQEFIEKVVFNLHPDFPNHQRVFKLPPYEVSESGYAGFELPIDIYFKNKEEPKKITYLYDLCLLIKEAVRNTRREKLTFQNPSLEFKKKLLGGGGRIVGGKTTVASKDINKASSESSSSSSTSSKNRGDTKQSSTSPSPLHRPPSSLNVTGPPEGSTTPSSQKSVSKNHSNSSSSSSIGGSNKINHQPRVPGKDIASTQPPSKGSSSSKDKTSSVSSSSVKSSAKSDPAFTDLFGPPIQTRPSPDTTSHHKVKTEGKGERTPSSSSSSSAANKRLDDIKPDKNDLDKKLVKSERIKTEITEEIDTKKIPKTKATDRSRSKERDKGSKKDSSKKSKKRSTSSSSSRSSSSEKKDKSDLKKDKHKSNPDAKKDDKKSKLSGNESKFTPTLSSSSKSMPTTGASPLLSSSSSHKRKEVKKETFSSTKLSFNTSNNGVAFEIESIHSSQEKRWDSEKKSKKSNKNSNDIKDGKKKESSPLPHSKASKTDKSYDRNRDKNSSPTDDVRKTNGDTVSSSSRVNGNLAEDLQLSSSDSSVSSRDSSQRDKESNRKSKKRKKNNKKRSKHNDEEDGSPLDSQSDVSSQDEDDEVTLKKKHKKSLSSKRDSSYLKVLYWIRGKIDDMNDPDTLSRIVNEIERSQSVSLQVTDSSYNFDLLKLDDTTVERIKEIIQGQET